MKKVFVCSPLKGDLDLNIEKAKGYCRYVLGCGHVPYAPHVFFTQFLNDNVQRERELGMLGGIEFLKICDEIWVFGNTISEGMSKEISLAKHLNIPVRIIKLNSDFNNPGLCKEIDKIKVHNDENN